MRTRSYNKILYYIGIVIFISLVIQIYWNYRNYLASKQRFHNAIQMSVDSAIENYYASRAQGTARKRFTAFRQATSPPLEPGSKSVLKIGDTVGEQLDQLKPVQILDFGQMDRKVQIVQMNPSEVDIQNFVGKIIYSIKQDSIDLQKLDSLTKLELDRKEIKVDFALALNRNGRIEKLRPEIIGGASSKTVAKSPWLPENSSLTLYFRDEIETILRYNLLGVSLSAVLMASIVGCLFFLLSVIRNQKQLAEMKNDFINNITHEFKTPIATIKAALEGIVLFNKGNDPKKTAKYLDTSNEQLDKLHNMVEKLLEIATFDSSQMILKKERIDLMSLLNSLVGKYRSCSSEKSFRFDNSGKIEIEADPFHLENALSNVLDNAVKYGGDLIEVNVRKEQNMVRILIRDNGNSLTAFQIQHIFDKFYRVPKGNVHDVKGFGIGLFYTKQIIDQHAGEIYVEVDAFTDFLIRLPYE